MKLRSKTILLIVATFGFLLGSLYFVSSNVLMSGFKTVEKEDTKVKALLITDAVHAMVEGLSSKSADWAAWDDAYQFVQDGNKDFVDSNFAASALPNLKIDALGYYNEKGQPVKIAAYNLDEEKHVDFYPSLAKYLQPGSELLNHKESGSVKLGILNLPEGPMIFASRAVEDSEMSKPLKGTVFFGRLLSPKQVAILSETTHQNVSQYNFNQDNLPADIIWAKNNFTQDEKSAAATTSQVNDDKTIHGYALMKDYFGKPAIVYKSVIDRAIYAQGNKSLTTMLWLIFGAISLIGAVVLLGLEKFILSRLSRMTNEVDQVDQQAKKYVTAEGTDEISILGQQVNKMLVSIENTTGEIKSANKTIATMLNSVGQGFFIFDRSGQVDPIYSAACETLFEAKPAGLHFAEVLKYSKVDSNDWIDQLFQEIIDFGSLADLGPQSFENSIGSKIKLHYHPVRDENGTLLKVVCIATDVTNELLAKKELDEQKFYADRITKMVKNKNEFINFLSETRRIIRAAQSELNKNTPDIVALYRHIHTIKGGAGVFALNKVQDFAHHFESELSHLRKSTPAVVEQKLKELRHNMLQLNQLFESTIAEHADVLGSSIVDGEKRIEIPFSQVKSFYDLLKKATPYENLEYQFLTDFISQPVVKSFEHYNEIVQSLAEKLGKAVQPINFQNGQIPIYHEPYNELFTSLIHVFRNIVDHGFEDYFERDEAGKNPEGSIHVNFDKQNLGQHHQLVIKISDDGRGIATEKIKSKLIEKGVDVRNWSEHQLVNSIFESGLSTADQITETSGRGVGMNAVQEACFNLGGKCEVDSVAGKGTVLTLTVPYILNAQHQKQTQLAS